MFLVPPARIELAAHGLGIHCSIHWATGASRSDLGRLGFIYEIMPVEYQSCSMTRYHHCNSFRKPERNMFLTAARLNSWNSLTTIPASLQVLFQDLSKPVNPFAAILIQKHMWQQFPISLSWFPLLIEYFYKLIIKVNSPCFIISCSTHFMPGYSLI